MSLRLHRYAIVKAQAKKPHTKGKADLPFFLMHTLSIMFSGLAGGGGKTLVTMGAMASFSNKGLKIAPFKKGPDFIDPAWLSLAACSECRNLDVFLMGVKAVKEAFLCRSRGRDISVIEGNRGLYDGVDARGSFSSAELAVLLSVPVVLIIDCTKMTGTAGALALGCMKFNSRVHIAGVILNRVAGIRHLRVLKASVEQNTGIPVVGAIPKIQDIDIFERHLGLLPPQEHARSRVVIQHARQIAEEHLDLAKILRIARRKAFQGDTKPRICNSSFANIPAPQIPPQRRRCLTHRKRVGIIQDRAFQFYYPENIEAFTNVGAEIIVISAIRDKKIPELDLLYISGGFPETSARLLERNASFRKSLNQAVINGLRVYAECGGVVYLGRRLYFRQKTYDMTGILDMDFTFSEKPRGHGYTILQITRTNPFFKIGTRLQGHEFHYTAPKNCTGAYFAAEVKRGFGFDGRRDCVIYKNVFATYTHMHANGCPDWAEKLLGL